MRKFVVDTPNGTRYVEATGWELKNGTTLVFTKGYSQVASAAFPQGQWISVEEAEDKSGPQLLTEEGTI